MVKNRLSIKTVAAAGLATAAALGVSGLRAESASAATLVQTLISGNDCSGVFGQGFANCEVTHLPTGETFSPVIAKFDGEDPTGASIEINDGLYPSVDGSEWSFSNVSGNGGTGEWNYTQGAGDPSIKYWVTKAANNFNLFWMVDDTDAQAGGVCDPASDQYTVDCLAAAIAVTSGNWTTPLNPQGSPRGLSHLTFYNTGDVPPPRVPEPAMLLGLGVMAVAGLGSRLKRN